MYTSISTYIDKIIDNLEDNIIQFERTNTSSSVSLPYKIHHPKCLELNKSNQYPKITNVVVTVRLGVMIELKRLSLAFPNMGKGSKFPSNISKIDGGTNLIFTTGAIVTPGCETYYGAKYLAHLMRLMIESVVQPILIVNHKTGAKRIVNRNLQGLTKFEGFRIVNIVSNGRLTKNYISLAEMEADDDRLDWNPEYFPGLEQILTKKDVPFVKSEKASMTIFDSGKGVGMGVKTVKDCYMAYQYVVEKALKYPDRRYIPKNSNSRFLYRQEQKRLYNLEYKQYNYVSKQKRKQEEQRKRRQLSQQKARNKDVGCSTIASTLVNTVEKKDDDGSNNNNDDDDEKDSEDEFNEFMNQYNTII